MTPVVEVRDLRKSYGPLTAVDRLSLEVRSGEAVALLGPNGSGKTTTLRCIAGLVKPDSGEISVCGIDLRHSGAEARNHFSFLPQQPSFPLNLLAREVVDFHASLRGADRDDVKTALREAGLSKQDEERFVGEFSGGMRQRLSLAVACIPRAELMLLDEPTANLDPEASLRLRNIATQWKAAGRSLLFSTHVLSDVEDLADRVLVLVQGKAVVQETVSRLRKDIQNVARLRVDMGQPGEEHRQAALECGATEARLNCTSLLITAPLEKRFPILQRLNELGDVHHFESEAPSVEQIYLKYVGHEE